MTGCLGCPDAASGCPVGMTCFNGMTGGRDGGTPYCATNAAGIPPSCATDADCAPFGVPCIVLPILGGVSFKPCTR